MIKILKLITKEQGICLIKTELDVKAANIETPYEKDYVDNHLEHILQKLSEDVDNDMKVKQLKDFLTESVFTHYVDMVTVLDYIYAIRKSIRNIICRPTNSKFIFVTEFKNYQTDTDDQSDTDNQKEELKGKLCLN